MLAQRPGCAPQLQRACLVHQGCLLVRLPWCFSSLSACLQGNDSPLRFSRAQPRAGPRGRFEGGDGWLVRGSPPTPMRDRLWWCGVVSVEATLLPRRLLLYSPAPDLLRRGASPSASLGLREAGVFFLRLPQVEWSGPDLHPLCLDLLPLRCLGFFFSVLRSSVPPMTTAR
jgi:hypothetical protein